MSQTLDGWADEFVSGAAGALIAAALVFVGDSVSGAAAIVASLAERFLHGRIIRLEVTRMRWEGD